MTCHIRIEAGANLGIAAPGALAGEHQFMNSKARGPSVLEQARAGMKVDGGSSRAAPHSPAAPLAHEPPPML